MNSTSLESLMVLLHEDPQEAAVAYKQLHARLVRFFSISHTDDPVYLADQAMDRLARRAAEPGAAIESPVSFALGIARHLVQEDTRRRLRDEEISQTWNTITPEIDSWKQERLTQLDQCLQHLSPERRQLIESYYDWESTGKAEHHRQIAEQLGLSLNSLRNRVFRIRSEVETCLQRSDALSKKNTPFRRTQRGNDA